MRALSNLKEQKKSLLKKCKKCGKVLPITEFYKQLGGAYGVKAICIDCYRKRSKENYKPKPKKITYIKCSMCGEVKPSTEFYKYKKKYKKICKDCSPRYRVPPHIKEIGRINQFPCTLLLNWSQSAIECLEIGCDCSKCLITTESKCIMKKAVILLTMIHGKPDGYTEPTIMGVDYGIIKSRD